MLENKPALLHSVDIGGRKIYIASTSMILKGSSGLAISWTESLVSRAVQPKSNILTLLSRLGRKHTQNLKERHFRIR